MDDIIDRFPVFLNSSYHGCQETGAGYIKFEQPDISRDPEHDETDTMACCGELGCVSSVPKSGCDQRSPSTNILVVLRFHFPWFIAVFWHLHVVLGRYQMRAGKNQQLHLMVEEIRQRIESLRKENQQKRQWLDVS